MAGAAGVETARGAVLPDAYPGPATTARVRMGVDVGGSRDEALDGVKGALVLLMVVYHWANYFVGAEWEGYRYLRFLTPSFIFITGFLVSHVYLRRYPADSRILRGRLLRRGLKLLALFVALNAADTVTGGLEPSALAARWSAGRLGEVLLIGDGGAAFGILLPIAYFCLFAPGLLWMSVRLRLSTAVLALVLLVVSLALTMNGVVNPHLEQLAIACLGLAAGAGTPSWLERLARVPGTVIAAYAVYLAAIAVLNVQYWLQVIGVGLSVALIYIAALQTWWPAAARHELAVLGRYSLFAYIAQIGILQVLVRLWPSGDVGGIALCGSLIAAAVLTAAAVQMAIRIRARSSSLDRIYRMVFA
jgi:hypothetical protein